jgi:hypothetical protein
LALTSNTRFVFAPMFTGDGGVQEFCAHQSADAG